MARAPVWADDYDSSSGNSNYNAFEVTVRHTGENLSFLIGYTFSKSIDQASSISDALNPYNFRGHACSLGLGSYPQPGGQL
jgi:hypothetical protein